MNIEKIEGTCLQMCPKSELIMREKEGLLHPLEVDLNTINHRRPRADINKTVKCFSRSAAGQKMPTSSELRPASVLLKTVRYLLSKVVNLENMQSKWCVVYDFINDRLRAVRQDIIIQRISVEDSIQILIPIVRFHCYSAYRLCIEPDSKFNYFLNNRQTLECLKWLLVLFDDYEKSDEKSIKFNKERIEMEAIYLLLNLGDHLAMTRALNLKTKWRNSLIKNCIKISLCWMQRNFVRGCKLIKKLPPLLAAVVALHLPNIRRLSLEIMSYSYNSKVLQFPVSILTDILLYSDTNSTKNDIRHYNIKLQDDFVIFNKTDFNKDIKTVDRKYEKIVDKLLLQYPIEDILLRPIL